jgi:hypothetical protein
LHKDGRTDGRTQTITMSLRRFAAGDKKGIRVVDKQKDSNQWSVIWSTSTAIYFPCIREIGIFVHLRKVIFPESNVQGKYNYFEGEQIFISPLCKGNECFIPPGQRFGEFCQMKSFSYLCLQAYVNPSPKLEFT